jgi:hypothetical protein
MPMIRPTIIAIETGENSAFPTSAIKMSIGISLSKRTIIQKPKVTHITLTLLGVRESGLSTTPKVKYSSTHA